MNMETSNKNKIIIVGNPNVGKSVIFNNLTGVYATVSNYPGTTVEAYRGRTVIDKTEYEVVDTPGMYSFVSITEEEKVARDIILNERTKVILHIVDAKNLERMLPFTLQLIEANLPVILVLNIMDEAERLGIKINIESLENELGIPIVSTIGTLGKGIKLLKEKISNYTSKPAKYFSYDNNIEDFIKLISAEKLRKKYIVSKRFISILLLQDDPQINYMVKEKEPENYKVIQELIKKLRKKYSNSLNYTISLERQKNASIIVHKSQNFSKLKGMDFAETLSRMTMKPLTGYILAFIILYFGLYKFVGEFGAGTLVNFIEDKVFGEFIIPPATNFIEYIFPWKVLQDLFVHDYGLITLAMRYAVAIILPIVGTFFLVFAIIEDSGYLPRLAMLIDRLFKNIGLSGRAVIPMVLGFGCGTMAVVVTRTLPTRKERIMAVLLLSLCIPCSAQLGVVFGLLSNNPKALVLWLGIISLIFLLVGFFASKIMTGELPVFFMEVPPLRFPKITNVLIKTYTRVKWYFKEVFPLFILVSFFIWVGQITGIFDIIIRLVGYPVKWIGLPQEASVSYLFGFFRRDYGAAGLYDLNKSGLLNGNQLLISVITMTLFLPCVAQFLATIKESGWRVGTTIAVVVLFIAFFTGYFLNLIFNVFRIII
ncbi:MAG: ferrous iron transport protein B [Candidatus Firestonebacteria bacterium]